MNDLKSKFVKNFEVKGSVRTVHGVITCCQDDHKNWTIYSVIANSSGHLVERIDKHNIIFSKVMDFNALIGSVQADLIEVMNRLSNRSETWIQDEFEGMGFESKN
jgi:hypothetical protein